MGLEIKPIEEYPLEKVAYIVNLSHRNYPQPFFVSTEGLKDLIYFLNISPAFSFLGIRDKEPVGVVLNCINEAEKGIVYTFFWGVVPQYRSFRRCEVPVALELAKENIRFFQKAGFPNLRCTVLEKNRIAVNSLFKLNFRKVRRLFCLRMEEMRIERMSNQFEITECSLEKVIGLSGEFHKVQPSWEREIPQLKKLGLKNPQSFVATFNGDILGFIIFSHQGSKCIIEDLRLVDGDKQKSVGRSLLNHMFESAGCIRAEVNNIPEDEESLLQFYEDSGFDTYCSLYEMVLDLKNWSNMRKNSFL